MNFGSFCKAGLIVTFNVCKASYNLNQRDNISSISSDITQLDLSISNGDTKPDVLFRKENIVDLGINFKEDDQKSALRKQSFNYLYNFCSNNYLPFEEKISFLHKNFLLSLPKLEILDLSGQDKIDWHFFSISESIKHLSLRKSGINQLPKEFFPSGNNIEELDLSYNSIGTYSYLPFEQLKNLKKLYLRSNNLYRISSDLLKSLSEIEVLDLTSCHLQELPASIKNCTKLKVLLLSDNNLEEIPQEISELKELKYIDISVNPISTIPDAILKLAKQGTKINLEHLPLDQFSNDYNKKTVNVGNDFKENGSFTLNSKAHALKENRPNYSQLNWNLMMVRKVDKLPVPKNDIHIYTIIEIVNYLKLRLNKSTVENPVFRSKFRKLKKLLCIIMSPDFQDDLSFLDEKERNAQEIENKRIAIYLKEISELLSKIVFMCVHKKMYKEFESFVLGLPIDGLSYFCTSIPMEMEDVIKKKLLEICDGITDEYYDTKNFKFSLEQKLAKYKSSAFRSIFSADEEILHKYWKGRVGRVLGFKASSVRIISHDPYRGSIINVLNKFGEAFTVKGFVFKLIDDLVENMDNFRESFIATLQDSHILDEKIEDDEGKLIILHAERMILQYLIKHDIVVYR